MARLDRRAMFTSGAAAALLAATGVSLEAAPRAGGRLRIAVPKDGSFEAIVNGAVFESLTQIGPDGVLRGELATAWRSGDAGRDWDFDLKPGVMFHDGTPLGRTDVAASLRRAGYDAQPAPDGQAVRVRLVAPDAGLPMALATVPIRKTGADGDAAFAGTGCFRAVRADSGRHFLGGRVRDHHRAGQAGWVDTVEVVTIPDAAVRAEALRDGFVDVTVLPAPDGLTGRGDFRFHPSADDMALAAHAGVGIPRAVAAAPLDGGRIAERWWMV